MQGRRHGAGLGLGRWPGGMGPCVSRPGAQGGGWEVRDGSGTAGGRTAGPGQECQGQSQEPLERAKSIFTESSQLPPSSALLERAAVWVSFQILIRTLQGRLLGGSAGLSGRARENQTVGVPPFGVATTDLPGRGPTCVYTTRGKGDFTNFATNAY